MNPHVKEQSGPSLEGEAVIYRKGGLLGGFASSKSGLLSGVQIHSQENLHTLLSTAR